MEKQKFENLKMVRIYSFCGSCIPGARLVKENKKTDTVAFEGGDGKILKRIVSKGLIHAEICKRCDDYHGG